MYSWMIFAYEYICVIFVRETKIDAANAEPAPPLCSGRNWCYQQTRSWGTEQSWQRRWSHPPKHHGTPKWDPRLSQGFGGCSLSREWEYFASCSDGNSIVFFSCDQVVVEQDITISPGNMDFGQNSVLQSFPAVVASFNSLKHRNWCMVIWAHHFWRLLLTRIIRKSHSKLQKGRGNHIHFHLRFVGFAVYHFAIRKDTSAMLGSPFIVRSPGTVHLWEADGDHHQSHFSKGHRAVPGQGRIGSFKFRKLVCCWFQNFAGDGDLDDGRGDVVASAVAIRIVLAKNCEPRRRIPCVPDEKSLFSARSSSDSTDSEQVKTVKRGCEFHGFLARSTHQRVTSGSGPGISCAFGLSDLSFKVLEVFPFDFHGFVGKCFAEAKGTDGFSGDFQTSKPPWCKIVLEAGTWSFAGPHVWNLPLQSLCFRVVSWTNWFASHFQQISQNFCASEMLAPWKFGPYFFLKPECSHRTCYIYIYLRVWIRIIYLMNLWVNLQVVPNLWPPCLPGRIAGSGCGAKDQQNL